MTWPSWKPQDFQNPRYLAEVMMRIGVWICMLACLGFKLHAQQGALGVAEGVIARFDRDAELQEGAWSVLIQDLDDPSHQAERHSRQRLMPASTQKLLTTAAALKLLGPEHRFATTFGYSGSLENGVLDGDIVIRGGGDPTLGTSNLSGALHFDSLMLHWVATLKKTGVQQIKGRVVADASYFTDALCPSSWSFNDMGNYYGAAATGLSIHDNLFHLHFRTGGSGDSATLLTIEPEVPGLHIDDRVIAGPFGSGDRAYVHGMPGAHKYYVLGSLPPNRAYFGIKAALPEPPAFLAHHLIYSLTLAGIAVTGEVSVSYQRTPGFTALDTIYSPSLATIVQRVNQESDNLYAEHLLKHIGHAKVKQSDVDQSARALEAWLSAYLPSATAVSVADGSGLSRENLLTTRALVDLLRMMHDDSSYVASLAVSGRSGTFQSFCPGVPGRVVGKSGSIGGVKAYAGYIYAESGKRYAFAVIANNYRCSSKRIRQKWEELLVTVARGG